MEDIENGVSVVKSFKARQALKHFLLCPCFRQGHERKKKKAEKEAAKKAQQVQAKHELLAEQAEGEGEEEEEQEEDEEVEWGDEDYGHNSGFGEDGIGS